MAKRKRRRNSASGAGRSGAAARRKNSMQAKASKAFALLTDPSLSLKRIARLVRLPLDTVNSLAYRGAYKEYRPLHWNLPERRPLVRRVKVGRRLYESIAAAARDQGMSTKGVVHRITSDNFPDWRFV